MSNALLLAILAGCVSLLSAVIAVSGVIFTGLNARKIEQIRAATEAERERNERQREMAIYSAPLASAAFDLQSRIYNILKKYFADAYIDGSVYRESAYSVNYTVFLVAQWFCWLELTRTKAHFIELDTDASTRELILLQDRIKKEWATDGLDPIFRLFAGEQRAIGEALIVGVAENTTCMGYGAFLEHFPKGTNYLIDELRSEVERLGKQLEIARPRLTQLQKTLLDILEIFDPKALRFPRTSRSLARASPQNGSANPPYNPL